jgi:hypothetical protein
MVTQNRSLCIFYTALFTSHIDSTLLVDGDYQILPEPEVEISEDPGNVVGELTEAPNPSWKNLLTFLTPALPVKASPGHKPTNLHCNLHLYIYLCIKFLGIVWKP